MIWVGLSVMRQRTAAGLAAQPLTRLILKAVALTVALEGAIYYLHLGRGVPVMFGLFVLLAVILNYALTRTKWGRSMFAVGGNREPRVARGSTSAASICRPSSCAPPGGPGGILSRRGSPPPASKPEPRREPERHRGGRDRGTSLFGGRGSAWSAVLGIIVIQAISNGLTLLNLSSSLRYMITGGVLAIAVIVDSLARQSRVSHGRG